MTRQKQKHLPGQMVGIATGGLLSLMTSIGHRAGLFDTMASLPPSTSQQIAEATNLNERYVREWLGSMTTGGIIEYDPASTSYRLPLEHAASLTRAAGPGNLAALAQFVSLFGNVEDKLVDSFRNGGGVPYSEFSKFQSLMAEVSAGVVDTTLTNVTLPLITGMVQRLQDGIDVLDVGCGQGHAINVMAREFPNSRFTGYDFSEEGVAASQAEAKAWGLSNSKFVQQDVAAFSETGAYDLITAFDAIHDQASPTKVLANIARALRPGGVFLMVDIAGSSNLEDNMAHPMAPLMYAVSTTHCMTVSLALNGEGLGTMWGEQLARQKLADARLQQRRRQVRTWRHHEQLLHSDNGIDLLNQTEDR
ncbi:MAG: class I SAM-dependent methyltransferase [Dehalococcoidia bacterium]